MDAAGILMIAVCGARRSHKKKDARVHWTRALFSQLYFTTTFSAPRVSRASWSRAS